MKELKPFLCCELPDDLKILAELALNVRWTWNHSGDYLWRSIDPEIWDKIRNPWWILQCLSQEQIDKIRHDKRFMSELKELVNLKSEYLNREKWFTKEHSASFLKKIAYFSMEFGLGEAIPIYAGGLGILAGDVLKTASDLGVPIVGIGLLYQEGYFRQLIGEDGSQQTANPHNDPTNLPMVPVADSSGGWLRIPLELPGRTLLLRVWRVAVGTIDLYLLDSNDPMNAPADRSLIYKLYDEQPKRRLIQEMALGIGGWKLLEALGIDAEICHLNEGHASFAILERARHFMKKKNVAFSEALWATRAGNVFTTHTAVPAGFDMFSADIIEKYFTGYAGELGLNMRELLALGRENEDDPSQPFNMAYLAARGSISINGVSELHGVISRRIFQNIYPRWPENEVPVSSVTNGVHMPSWDCDISDELWMAKGGKGCWNKDTKGLGEAFHSVYDEEIWSMRNRQRETFINNVRRRMVGQFRRYASDEDTLSKLQTVLDASVLTLGFARRFATYKRPDLLLTDPERLLKILKNPKYPVQLVFAGKAHPKDEGGRALVQKVVQFARRPEVRAHMVFLPDYDMYLAQELVMGVDVWINNPRRPWEACGTSGMKVLVNGGLNLSVCDGWWAEAFTPDVGWAIGDMGEHGPEHDAEDAEELYSVLEEKIIPEFYDRNSKGIPVRWVERIRSSMSDLAPRFSSSRMLIDYVEKIYEPAAVLLKGRNENDGRMALELCGWQKRVRDEWPRVGVLNSSIRLVDNFWKCTAEISLGGMKASDVCVELYACTDDAAGCVSYQMKVEGEKGGGRYIFTGTAPSTRAAQDHSLRILPYNKHAVVPSEDQHILWLHPIPVG